MSLLSVTVKTARFVGPQASQWNSYVTLKLQHVKSTTAQVKGANPCWGQDFLFEINNLDAGLLIEVWASGRMWDNSVGYHWLHLKDIQHANWVIHGTGKWLSLDAELVMRDGQVVGTKTPTGHELLVDARFELPYGTSEVEVDDAVDLQRKLEMYNSMLDEETRAEQARKQHQYYIQSGVSEDSDYTSDINYPVGQHPNSSASQFLSAANQLTTPQRSLTSSRENSYEKDDDYRTAGSAHDPYQPPPYSTGHRKQLPTVPPHPSNHRNHGQSSTGRTSHRKGSNSSYWDEQGETATEGDPLYYNSRPQSNYRPYSSPSYRGRGDSWGDDGYSKGDQTLRQYSDGYDDAQDYSQRTYSKRHKASSRRGTPSLERQYTMYHGHDDHYGDYYSQEPTDQNGQTKQTPRYHAAADAYSSSTYQQQNLYNAQKNSVYDEYSDQYGDYGSAGTICNDYSIASVDGSALNQQTYANDTSYSDYGWGGEENSLRDQYNRTNAAAAAASSKRSGKELPQLPVPQSQSQQVSPYASQSTVKEVSVSSMNVPAIIATQYEDPIIASTSIPTTSTNDRLVNSHDYISDLSTSVADESFYDAVSNTTSAYDNYSTAGVITSTTTASYGVSKAVTSVVDSSSLSQQQDPQQYMGGSYETQVGYEDWQNYGYYDESGQYIAYDQTGYYDDQVTITEETVGSVAAIVDVTSTVSTTVLTATTAAATTLAQQQQSEFLQYSTKDQYDPYSSSVTTTAPTTTSAALSGSLQTTEVQVHSHHQEDTPVQYDNTEYYDAEGDMMQVEYGGYEGTEYGMEYGGDSYGYTDPAYDPTSIEPSQNLNDKTNLNSKSNIEYNYAYQSAENLSQPAAFDNGYSTTTLDRSNSVSRRASFKRQTSTRDYGYSETMDTASVHSSQNPPHSSARNSLTPATAAGANSLPPASAASVTSTAPTTSSHGASHMAHSGAAAVGAAANAATKLTSEIKSALPQLTSLTKAKTGGLFSSGFSKFGSFMTNAAEKTGVPVPPIIKDSVAAAAAATAPKDVEKTNVETVKINQQQNVVANHVDMTHGKSSMQPGMSSFDEQLPYDGEVWDDGQQIPIDHHRPPHHPNHYNDAYFEYEGTEEGPESNASGPVHMDSLESNVSEGGGKDPESTIEAQYWQKQKERIAKQNSMAAVDSDVAGYDLYDPYDKRKGVFQTSVDSPVPQNGDQSRSFSITEYEKQHSLDRDEWLSELDRQAGVSRPGVLKRGETSDMSFDRGDSLDQRHPDDYGDDYMDELPRSAKGSIDASGGYPIEPLHKDDVILGREADRKTSLEMAPMEKEKGSKSVSFEEEPPKAIPVSQTKGMTPREKWLWAINRIQLAVSSHN